MPADRTALVAALGALGRAVTPTAWTTPVDVARHRRALAERVRRGDTSPYPEPFLFPDADLAPVRDAAQGVRDLAVGLPDALRALVEVDVANTLAHAEAVASRDDARLVAWSIGHAGLPTAETVAEASRLLSVEVANVDPPTEDAGAVRDGVLAAFERHGIGGWEVVVTDAMAARMSVNGARNRVRIRADLSVTAREKDRLLAHEVGSHVLRWVNARRQPEPLAAFSFGPSVETEEGLAALREEEFGLSSAATLRTYAARVMGVLAAQELDLVGLAFRLHEVLDAEAAAELALRLRRGIGDPRRPGGLTKDHGYLSGLLALRSFAPGDVELLRGVKWSRGHLDLVRILAAEGRLRTPTLQYVPDAVGA